MLSQLPLVAVVMHLTRYPQAIRAGFSLKHSLEGGAAPTGSVALFVHSTHCDAERLRTAMHVPLRSPVRTVHEVARVCKWGMGCQPPSSVPLIHLVQARVCASSCKHVCAFWCTCVLPGAPVCASSCTYVCFLVVCMLRARVCSLRASGCQVLSSRGAAVATAVSGCFALWAGGGAMLTPS